MNVWSSSVEQGIDLGPWISTIFYHGKETICKLVQRLTVKRLSRETIALKTQWLENKGCSLFDFNVEFLSMALQDPLCNSAPLEAQSSNE